MIDTYQSQSVPSGPIRRGTTEVLPSSDPGAGAICRPLQTTPARLSAGPDTWESVTLTAGGR